MRKTLAIIVLSSIAFGYAEAMPTEMAPNHSQKIFDTSEKVDINHATLDELIGVPGLTRVWAIRVIRYRPYRAKNQLLLKGIVPGEVYEQIKDFVVAHQRPR